MKYYAGQRFGNATVIKSNDWCHLCGERAEGLFFEFTVPNNAEHSKKDESRGFFRFCKACISMMKSCMDCGD